MTDHPENIELFLVDQSVKVCRAYVHGEMSIPNCVSQLGQYVRELKKINDIAYNQLDSDWMELEIINALLLDSASSIDVNSSRDEFLIIINKVLGDILSRRKNIESS